MLEKKVLEKLENNRGQFFSGEALALELNVSRTAIWKAITKLKSEGHIILSHTKRGYALSNESNIISKEAIHKLLPPDCPKCEIIVLDSVDSTNNYIKNIVSELECETCVIANKQTSGKGRNSKTFLSSFEGGLYFSRLTRPNVSITDAITLTCRVAVATAITIEEVTGDQTSIKWVNDIFVKGKKVSGLLTEGSVDIESGYLEYAIIGIGINTNVDIAALPPELQAIIGNISCENIPNIRNILAARLIHNLNLYTNIDIASVYTEYRSRLLAIGEEITVISPTYSYKAKLLDITPNFALVVQKLDDNSGHIIQSGEISIKVFDK